MSSPVSFGRCSCDGGPPVGSHSIPVFPIPAAPRFPIRRAFRSAALSNPPRFPIRHDFRSAMLPDFPRSPELMSRDDTGLLVVDVQEKLIGLIGDHRRVVWNIRRLIDAAGMLGLPVLATEQYPRGLGPTVAELRERIAEIPEKVKFSCGGCPQAFADLGSKGVEKLLVVGIECHVCVQQTVFDLLTSGMRVYVAVDAVGSRHPLDYETALRRMDSAGATLTTTEAALFEWCESAAAAEFKQISQLVREPQPEDAG